jgi:hypothetical protein
MGREVYGQPFNSITQNATEELKREIYARMRSVADDDYEVLPGETFSSNILHAKQAE